MKARAAVNGFVAEGSAYETEKEIGRGKRKKRRNRLFEDSESDEEIKKCKKKLIPAPPSVPFKCIRKKNVIENPQHKFKNFSTKATSPSTKVSHMFVQYHCKLNIFIK